MSIDQHDVPHAHDANTLPCPEIRNYTAVIVGDRYVVTYEWRGPGETAWQPVRLSRTARPEDQPTAPVEGAA